MNEADSFIQAVTEAVGENAKPEDVVRHLLKERMIMEKCMAPYHRRRKLEKILEGSKGVRIMSVCQQIGDEEGVDTITIYRSFARAIRA